MALGNLNHIPKQPTPPSPSSQKTAAFALRVIGIVSPLMWIVIALGQALYVRYHNDLLTDPGHKRIKIYDQLVIIVTIFSTMWVFAYTYNFDLATYSRAVDENVLLSTFFVQFSGWASFIVLYTLSMLLYLYEQKRLEIIRKTNERHKVW